MIHRHRRVEDGILPIGIGFTRHLGFGPVVVFRRDLKRTSARLFCQRIRPAYDLFAQWQVPRGGSFDPVTTAEPADVNAKAGSVV